MDVVESGNTRSSMQETIDSEMSNSSVILYCTVKKSEKQEILQLPLVEFNYSFASSLLS